MRVICLTIAMFFSFSALFFVSFLSISQKSFLAFEKKVSLSPKKHKNFFFSLSFFLEKDARLPHRRERIVRHLSLSHKTLLTLYT